MHLLHAIQTDYLQYNYRGIGIEAGEVAAWRNTAQYQFKNTENAALATGGSGLAPATDFGPSSLTRPSKLGLTKKIKWINDYNLLDLANGLQHHPTGSGRRVLTMCIEKARELKLTDVSMNGLNAFIAQHNIGSDLDLMVTLPGDKHPDKVAFRDAKKRCKE